MPMQQASKATLRSWLIASSVVMGLAVLSGCEQEADPTPEPEAQEPMDHGPMADEGQATEETLNDDL